MMGNEKISELIDKRRYSEALKLLFDDNHPVIFELYPRLKSAKPNYSSKIHVEEDDVLKLESFVERKKFSNLVVSSSLVVVGGIGIAIGSISLLSLWNIPPVVGCFGFMGLPFLLMGIQGLKNSCIPNPKMWEFPKQLITTQDKE